MRPRVSKPREVRRNKNTARPSATVDGLRLCLTGTVLIRWKIGFICDWRVAASKGKLKDSMFDRLRSYLVSRVMSGDEASI
jgi:hypothetical protein